MDIRCPKCSEPWDMDSLHEEVAARFSEAKDLPQQEYAQRYDIVRKDFYARGCVALESFGAECNAETVGSDRARASSALMDLLGDDVDGLAAMEEDFDLFGGARDETGGTVVAFILLVVMVVAVIATILNLTMGVGHEKLPPDGPNMQWSTVACHYLGPSVDDDEICADAHGNLVAPELAHVYGIR